MLYLFKSFIIKILDVITIVVNDVKYVLCCYVCSIVLVNRFLMMYIYMYMFKVLYNFVMFLFVWNFTSVIR